MAEFPALPLWTDAYLGDTTHLSTIEHGAYLLLLITAWRTRDIALPDDDRILARYARCSASQWKRLRPILEPFFTIEAGKWTQGRLTDEAESVRRKKEAAASNGRASALKRQGRHSTKRERSDSEASTDAQRKSNLTITNKKPPVSPNDEKPTKHPHPLPDDWQPIEFGKGTQCRIIVDGWGRVDFERQVERFRSHHQAAGTRWTNWQAAWSKWVLNSVNFDQPRRAGPNSPGGSSFADLVLTEAAQRERPPP